MTDNKDLAKQIADDDKKAPASAEKPLKIKEEEFDKVIDKILPSWPQKPKDN